METQTNRRSFLKRSAAQAGAVAGGALLLGGGAGEAKATMVAPVAEHPVDTRGVFPGEDRYIAEWKNRGGETLSIIGNHIGLPGRTARMDGGRFLVNDNGRIFEVDRPILTFAGGLRRDTIAIHRGGFTTDGGIVFGAVNGKRYVRRIDDLKGFCMIGFWETKSYPAVKPSLTVVDFSHISGNRLEAAAIS